MASRLERLRLRPRRSPEHPEPATGAHPGLPKAIALAAFAPLALIASEMHIVAVAFPLSVLALVGGAFLLGEAAEVAASRLGDGIGSLVTATLSNMVTLAILGAAMVQGLYSVVLASITGAILGNILFALGGAMLLGGLGREKQSFGREAAAVNSTLLMVASFAFLLPAILGVLVRQDPLISEKLAVPICAVLLSIYVLGLLFSTRTHKHLFNPTQKGERHRGHPVLEKFTMPVLAGSVVLVGAMASIFADTITPLGEAAGLPPLFLGMVVVGLVANSVEISTAWKMARKDHMHAALQIATGSGIQVMLFVTPLLVLLSPLLPSGLLALEFPMTMAVAIGMGAVLVNVVASDGESTWYEGALLLALFAIFALVFYVLP